MTDIIERATTEWQINAQLTSAMTPYRDGLPPLLRRPEANDTLRLPPMSEPPPVREPVTVVYRAAAAEPERPDRYRGRRRAPIPLWAWAVAVAALAMTAGAMGGGAVLAWAVAVAQ